MIGFGLSKGDLLVLDVLLRQRVLGPYDLRSEGAEPADIERSVKRLVKHGCRIEPRGEGSFELIESGLEVWSDYLGQFLTGYSKRKVEVYRRTTSTQDLAKRRAGKPLVVIADEQTAGRGRLGRTWLAPPGSSVLMSVTCPLDPGHGETLDRLALIAAVGVAQAIESLTGHRLVQIKWPNDLIVDRGKIAGILIEADRARHAAIIGIGINVALTKRHIDAMPETFRGRITSFALHGWRADRLLVAATVINRIDELLHHGQKKLIVDEWRCRNVLSDDVVTFRADGQTLRGTVVDLDADDGLIVRRDTGELVHLHAATTMIEPG